LNNGTTLAHAIGIILAYITSTRSLVKIVNPMRRYMRGYTAVTDLFNTMQKFGRQTIPMFGGQAVNIIKGKTYTVDAQGLIFGYKDATIFNEHSLHIDVQADQQNKLFGIIGPSGGGKTTLLSILGGQLRPLDGQVLINGIDIYQVDDAVRRQLIALQGQIATSAKGSVRYNMLFGLPQDHGYDDAYLWHIIDKIGLKTALESHHGLDTMLGEGALNISGGQRQRLNFAGLYLRACYYKPVLILIDEPTSSLDEISERAITQMIGELASSAITLVIAHRLKTLQEAQGLIDLTLLASDKDIKIYTPDELKSRSDYYESLFHARMT
jgi:ABC-type multidrug transport system fused ATPase/permease subunit